MPTQTAKVPPGIDVDFTFGGEATAAWNPVPVAAIVDDPSGAPDGIAGRFLAAFAATRTAYVEYQSASIPAGILSISAVRMKARALATGTEDVWDLDVTGFVRPAGGSGSSGAFFHGSPVTITSLAGAGETYQDVTIGTWTVDPDTSSPWTASTLRSMSWGARFAAPATDPAVNGSAKLDQIYLEIDYVTVAADIDGVRANASSLLRLFRREPELVEITGPLLLGDADVLELFGIEHPEGPAPGAVGWGAELWERALLLVLSRTVDLLANTVKVVALNPRHYWTRWWSTFLTDLGHSLDGQGIPLLHSGAGGIVVARAQAGYLERSGRPADGVVMAAGENQPKYDRRGLLVEKGGATNLVLHSTFSGGSGNTFTNWTKGESGTGTVVETAEHIGFDVEGLRRSALLDVGATDASIATITCDAVSVSGSFRVRIRTKNLFGAAKLAAVIRRASDGNDWNDTTEAFEPPTVVNRVGANAGGHRDWHSKLINPGGADAITIHIGYHGEAGTSIGGVGFKASVTSVEIYEGETHIGSDLPTTTAAVARVEDVVTIDNPAVGRMWPSISFGSFILAVVPMWSDADLASGQEKVFLYFQREAAEEILYKKGTGFMFRRGNGTAAVKAVSGAALPVKGVQQKITVRWVADGGELGMPDYSHEIAVDGEWGTMGLLDDPPEQEPSETVYVGSDNSTRYADAFLSHADVSPLCLTDEELERRAP
jgi:hypothetical protein